MENPTRVIRGILLLAATLFLAAVLAPANSSKANSETMDRDKKPMETASAFRDVYFAGGCFCGVLDPGRYSKPADAELKKKLTPEEYNVTQKAGCATASTAPPFVLFLTTRWIKKARAS